jgi:hypothetical protein
VMTFCSSAVIAKAAVGSTIVTSTKLMLARNARTGRGRRDRV